MVITSCVFGVRITFFVFWKAEMEICRFSTSFWVKVIFWIWYHTTLNCNKMKKKTWKIQSRTKFENKPRFRVFYGLNAIPPRGGIFSSFTQSHKITFVEKFSQEIRNFHILKFRCRNRYGRYPGCYEIHRNVLNRKDSISASQNTKNFVLTPKTLEVMASQK